MNEDKTLKKDEQTLNEDIIKDDKKDINTSTNDTEKDSLVKGTLEKFAKFLLSENSVQEDESSVGKDRDKLEDVKNEKEKDDKIEANEPVVNEPVDVDKLKDIVKQELLEAEKQKVLDKKLQKVDDGFKDFVKFKALNEKDFNIDNFLKENPQYSKKIVENTKTVSNYTSKSNNALDFLDTF